ncbi:MAG: aminomethyl transferase family protein, partial [Pseudomonadota bacterium]
MSFRDYSVTLATEKPTLPVVHGSYEISPFAPHFHTDDLMYGIYSRRLFPLKQDCDVEADYKVLRNAAVLYDVPERPHEIRGPDAEAFLNHVLTRRISDMPAWRGRYALACNDRGGLLMDGIVFRFSDNHFWYVLASGEFEPWLEAKSSGFDVELIDPESWVLQVQGPRSLDVMRDAVDGDFPELKFYQGAMCSFAGQSLFVTRTGYTGEFGFEIYSRPDMDYGALFHHLMAAGAPHGMEFQSLESMNVRRIEAGIFNNSTDLFPSMTPYDAGLGAFVDVDMGEFVGAAALRDADRRARLYGLVCDGATPDPGNEVL